MTSISSSSEIASLRQELLLRILFQNTIIQVLVVLFVLMAGLAILRPEQAGFVSLIFQIATLASALQWCHHGIRTRQIKQFLTLTASGETGLLWEDWLPANRPPSLLGSRWMISTKGVFLGLAMAMLGVDLILATAASFCGRLAAVLWLATAGFLLTNPKE
ncbi:hypothetical protein [Fuscibacter oryzae]|uniref:Uncharacterized protein n=1 Tax=Fuscibacter oryzae TaxID=2803939 RepID=A0A8J7MUN8_9RHOB|nr:hypothetical protein [Fuscibacter oryzae]MBL4929992.1 hypothetical protein [Fuscibacter oryzae]